MSNLSKLLSRCTRGKLPYLLLTVAAALFFLPGVTRLPPTDRDEARYVQATRQMLESGDYTRIKFQDTPRHKKPIGIYWLQAAAVTMLSEPESSALWVYRLPSLLSAWLAVLLLFYFGQSICGREAAFLGALCLASTLLLIGESHLAKTDAALLASVVAAQGVLALAFLKRDQQLSWPHVLLFWVAGAAGVLIKGPVLPLVVGLTGLTLLVVRRDRRWVWKLRPLLGIPLAVVLVLPWFIAIQGATAGHFVKDAWLGDILPKLVGAHESHGGFPGYYLLLSNVTFWPWSLYLVPALYLLWRERRSDSGLFLASWLVPAWAVLELVPTKLPHYALPLYPVLALLVGGLLLQGGAKIENRTAAILNRIAAALWFVITAVFAIACLATPWIFSEQYLWRALIPAAGLLGALYAARRDEIPRRPAAIAAGALSMLLFLAYVFPALDNFWPSARIAAAVRNLSAPGKVLIVDYREPSVVFLLGTDTLLTTAEEAANRFRETCPATAVVPKAYQESFARAAEPGAPVDSFRAFNYSKGKWVELSIYERRGC